MILTEERRHHSVLEAANELEALASQSTEKPEIRQYIGQDGVKEAFNLLFLQPKGTEFLVYGSLSLETDYADFLANFAHQRIKKNYPARLIYTDSPKHREVLKKDLGQKLIEIKFLNPKDFEFKTHEVCIFGDTVAYLAHSEHEPFATVIESDTLAVGERQIFELVWKIAKE
jgi:hypothetical protein